MLYILFLIITYVFSQTPNYCRREDGIKITGSGQCLSSTLYNVQNCCFECLQINPINQSSVIKCGSIYALGFNTCNNQSKTAALAACGGGAYTCLCNPGSDKSQVTSGSNLNTNNITLFLFLNSLFIFFNKYL